MPGRFCSNSCKFYADFVSEKLLANVIVLMERQVKYNVHLNTLTLGVAIASKFAFQRKELIAIKDFPEQKVWF